MAYNRWHSSSGSYEPLMYVKGHPVDLTTFITALHVITTAVCALLLGIVQNPAWIEWVVFNTQTFWQGRIWTLLTDPFVHNIASEHIWLALNLYFFYRFGTEMESLIGRASFGLLYLALMVVPGLVCLAAAPLLGTPMGVRIPYILTPAHFAIFIGYAFIYPGVCLCWGIPIRAVAWAFIAATALAIIALGAWLYLIPFAATLATVYFYLKFVGTGRHLGILDVWQSWREQKHDQKIQKRKARLQSAKREETASVDAILDKISEQGLHSLTPQERAFLEQKGTQLRASEGKAR